MIPSRCFLPIYLGLFLLFSPSGVAFADDALEVLILQEQTFAKIAQDVSPAIVSISTDRATRSTSQRSPGDERLDDFYREFFYGQVSHREFKQLGLGSGLIIDETGYIVTNEHVISGAEKIIVSLTDGRQFSANLKGTDSRADLAILKIEADGLISARLGDSEKLSIGQWAIAMGNPLGFALANQRPGLSLGVIGSLRRSLPKTTLRSRAYMDLIQTDVSINPGNSGGPLLNIKGEVVGINVAVTGGRAVSEGVGFAIPINEVKLLLIKLLKGEEALSGWIGIGIQDLNLGLAEYFGLQKPDGVLVIKVLSGSAAEIAGIQPEDIIVKLDEEKISNSLDFIKVMGKLRSSQRVKLKLLRKGLMRTIEVSIQSGQAGDPVARLKPEQTGSSEIITRSVPEDESARNDWRGIRVSGITEEMVVNFDFENKNGVIVTNIIAESSAEKSGLRINDVIIQLNTVKVNDLDDFEQATKSLGSGSVLVKTTRGFFMVQ